MSLSADPRDRHGPTGPAASGEKHVRGVSVDGSLAGQIPLWSSDRSVMPGVAASGGPPLPRDSVRWVTENHAVVRAGRAGAAGAPDGGETLLWGRNPVGCLCRDGRQSGASLVSLGHPVRVGGLLPYRPEPWRRRAERPFCEAPHRLGAGGAGL